MDCYSCANPAMNACKRCAKPYCEDHGNEQYCADCLRPASALPSFNLYRGALLTMLAGTALAVFLIVRPPGESDGASPVVVGRSTPTATPVDGTPEPTVRAETPQSSPSPRTASPTAAPTEAPFLEYTIADGDTLSGIAGEFLPVGDDITAYITAIATLNGISEDTPLQVGETLLLPRPAAE